MSTKNAINSRGAVRQRGQRMQWPKSHAETLYRGGVPCPEPRKDMKMFATQKEGAETRGQHSQGVEQ